VNNTDSSFTEKDLIKGLSESDAAVIQFIYSHYKLDTIKSVQSAGGTLADGNVFFQTAFIDAAQLSRQHALPEDVPLKEVFTHLAKSHYLSWSKRNIVIEEQVDTEQAAPLLPSWIPDNTALSQTRKHIFVWKTMGKLSTGCQISLMQQQVDDDTTCKTELVQALAVPVSELPESETNLPDYAIEALLRKEDFLLWKTIRAYDDNIDRGLTIDGKEIKTDNTVAKYAFISLVVLTLAYVGFTLYNRPKSTDEIFKQNFEPPQSLLDDMNRRYENDTTGIVRPERCTQLLAQADAFYAEKNYAAAQDPLYEILNNDDLDACRSDAMFAMGIISLKTNDPAEALQFLSKIDNIEVYGEDLYWYQALAFVQMAKRSASYRVVARRAMERFLENTRNETRRIQGENMLNELK
jgi:hypothetical protein